ncbi:hypothetical protein G6F68_014168 [Rhizopus microsporus]|nr:hypothetical protein G6F68_014168 [Rhizopus microsporus]
MRDGSPSRPSPATRLSTASCTIAVRVASEALPMCGASRRQAAIGQCVGQCGFIDQAATGDVHQRGRRLHLRQRGGIDQVMRRRGVRQHQQQVVGLRKQRIQVHVGGTQRRFGVGRQLRAVVVEHLHAETECAAAGDALADAAHAENAERAAVDVGTEHGLERPLLPLAFTQPALGFGDAARGGHQQGETEVGRGLGEHVRGVAGEDAGRA